MLPQIIIILFVLIACLCLIRGIYETYVLKISHEALGYDKGSKKSQNKIRVFLFSDIHASYLKIPASLVAGEIKKSGADVVLFAGDMVNKGCIDEFLKLKDFFQTISDAAKDVNIPIFAVCGNHDNADLTNKLVNTKSIDNLQFLSNSSVVIKSSDKSVWQISGLEDMKTGIPDYRAAHRNLQGHSEIENDLPEIILSHNPDSIYALPFISNTGSENIDNKFLLSGHFHGGQIWMPFGLEYKILRKEKMAAEGFRRGSFEYKGLKGYITRGLGCVVIPLRFFSFPEVVVLDLYGTQGDGSSVSLNPTQKNRPLVSL